MSIIAIKKAKLKDHNLFLEVEFEENIGGNVINKIKRESTAPVHQDLVTAFTLLVPHFAYICEEITRKDFLLATDAIDVDPVEQAFGEGVTVSINGGKEIPVNALPNLLGEYEEAPGLMDSFAVTGFVITGNDDDGVLMIGRKVLSNGKIMNMNSPITRLDPDAEDYGYASDLAQALEQCKYEILEFLTNGKVAPERQQEIEFPEEGEEEV